MKRLVVSVFLLITVFAATAQNKKVAVMETKTNESVTSFQSNMVRGGMETAVSNAPGFEGYDRAAFDVIMKEQTFQRSGAVNENQITKIGQMAGVQYVLVTEASAEKNDFYILAKLLDVETGRFVKTAEKLCKAAPSDIKDSCAELANTLLTLDSKPDTTIPKVIVQPKPNVTKAPLQTSTGGRITKDSYFYYLDGKIIDDGQYVKLLESCPQAWKEYQRGCKKRKTGRTLLTIGGGLVIAGAVVGGIVGAIQANYSTFWYAGVGAGSAAILGATPLAIISIPFFTSGKKLKNNAYNIYNQYCSEKATATLSFGPTGNGVGVSLNF